MSLLRRFVDNPVLANMLMVLILAGGGLAAAFLIPRELFPEFSRDIITVTVPYPGASPTEVEDGIVLKIEEKVQNLEGVKEVSSQASEGVGVVTIELRTDADVRKVLDEVNSEVDKIDFPLDAEDPTVVEQTLKRPIIHVAIAGPEEKVREQDLKELAEEIRDEINELPEISQVAVSGVRDYEISVEVSEQALRRYELTLGDVAAAIRRSSFDMPAGTVKTREQELAIRIVGERREAREFRDIVVLSRPDGTVVTLDELASVRQRFEDVDTAGFLGDKPAALVVVSKTPEEDSIQIAEAVKAYVARKQGEMPEGLELRTWADYSKVIVDRLDLLVNNGMWGLMLVFAILWLFLGFRMSFWVAMGIPVSLMGTMILLELMGQTLNMMSMFALIMALGLIVDDAIVVGENIHSETERGRSPLEAAVGGTQSVLWPVVGAVVTTWLAFAPLMLIEGVMGRFIEILPTVVITALAFSLVECLLILPAHLGHRSGMLDTLLSPLRSLPEPAGRAGRAIREGYLAMRSGIERAIQVTIDRGFMPLHRLCVRWRFVTLGVFVGLMIVAFGAYKGDHIRTNFFPKIDSDTIKADLVLPTGTGFQETSDIARRIAAGAEQLNKQFGTEDGRPIIRNLYALAGQTMRGGQAGGHVAEVIVELAPGEVRTVKSQQIAEQWRQNVGPVPQALSLTYGALRGGPGGRPFEIRLLGDTVDQIKPAARELKEALTGYAGVFDVEDDALPGKMEMRIRKTPRAETLNITLDALATQIRDAFEGREVVKIQQGREEIEVVVRYPPRQRRTLSDVENMRIRTPAGDEIPFYEVADVSMAQGYTTLRRVGDHAAVTVSADLDESVANAEQVLAELRKDGVFADLERKYAPLKVDLRGQRQQAMESLSSLMIWFPLALVGIYTVLAAIFRSYVQPIIIMVAIPFGLLGAVVGHWLLGMSLTLLSLFGMVALTGIVVNDSLVLIDLINQRFRGGTPVIQAVFASARDRFRPIFLTTATTVCGIAPLLLEQSFQAQFLKPMVVSLAFGLMFATLLTLLVVPCLYVIGSDIRRSMRWIYGGQWTPAAQETVD